MEAPSEPIETKPPSDRHPRGPRTPPMHRGTPLGFPGPLPTHRGTPSGVPRTAPAPLDRLEPVELAGGRDTPGGQGLDLGPARPLVQERLELVEAVGVALGLDPDRAVGQVLGVAGEPQLDGLALHRPAEADALDLAPDHGLEPHGAHGWIVTGAPSGRVSASREMVSLSMRTHPLDTGLPTQPRVWSSSR